MTESEILLKKARRNLRSVELLMADGDFDAAASRCYYAMFLAAEALLLMKDVRPFTHGGTLALVGKHFVLTGELDPAHGRALKKAYMLRQRGDYGVEDLVTKGEVGVALASARDFVNAVETLIERLHQGASGRGRSEKGT